jgi:nucleotide-binding universal stress UspA family protein
MQHFQRILAATDFSPGGDAAARQAFSLAAGGECRIVLAHVIELASPPNPLYAHYAVGSVPSPEQLERIKAEAMRALEALVPAGARSHGLKLKLEVRAGHPVEVLLDLAKQVAADVIVIGDSGRGTLSRALLGSVADRLVHHAPCSVLVARARQA